MIKSITQSEFTSAFHRAGRGTQFSHKGLLALYDYLEQLENDCDMSIELDVIALCCEYCEYDSLEELQTDYSDIKTLEDLYNHTQVIELDNDGLIIQSY